jgi:hypothetical protein
MKQKYLYFTQYQTFWWWCYFVRVCWSKEHQLLGPVLNNAMYWDHYKSTFIPTPPSCCLKGCLVVWWRCSKQLWKCHHHYGQPIKSSHYFLMILCPDHFSIHPKSYVQTHFTIHPKSYVQTILPFIQNTVYRDHFTGASWDALKHLSQNWQ